MRNVVYFAELGRQSRKADLALRYPWPFWTLSSRHISECPTTGDCKVGKMKLSLYCPDYWFQMISFSLFKEGWSDEKPVQWAYAFSAIKSNEGHLSYMTILYRPAFACLGLEKKHRPPSIAALVLADVLFCSTVVSLYWIPPIVSP